MLSEQDKTNQKIKSTIKDIFPDALTASRMVDNVVTKRPAGWSRKSNASYFNEHYGKQMRDIANSMLQDKENRMFRYAIFCGENQELMSHNTLYTRIIHSRRYLGECMDTDDKRYTTWLNMTECEIVKSVGISIKFKPFIFETDNSFVPDKILKDEEKPKWKTRMEDWIESGDTTPFIQEKLILSPDDIILLKQELSELVGILAFVNSSCIKIIKVNK